MSDSAQWNVRLAIDAFAAIEPEIGQFLSRVGVEGAAAYTSQLVVEEIVRNLIEHTPPYATDEMVDVAIAVTAQRVTVVIEDRRPPFDPSNAPPLDVDVPRRAATTRGHGFASRSHYGRRAHLRDRQRRQSAHRHNLTAMTSPSLDPWANLRTAGLVRQGKS